MTLSKEYRVGVDIGGTFTDIVFLSKEGKLVRKKLSSTPDDYSRAILDGIQEVFSENKLSGSNVAGISHGCTVASNAIIEHTGGIMGLITTKGFRDILEIGRYRMPVLYDTHWEKPMPLISREYRLEVDEKIDRRGKVLHPLDIESAKAAIDKLVSKGSSGIAVCLLNSYANPIHEQKIKALIQEKYPGLFFSISSELNPQIKEYERTSETVINTYVKSVMVEYLTLLENTLLDLGIKEHILIMQSNGGLMPLEIAKEKPVSTIESGPAAGVVGARELGQRLGIPNIIALDMGGTTTKVSIIEDYKPARVSEYEVGAGILIGSRLCTGGGYPIRVASIDIAEIGAGGGSKLWLDKGGVLHSGPESAGAVPGPACYDLGGVEPTLTDADVVLGYINPEYLTGGTTRLNAAKAHEAINEKLAKPLKLDTVAVAYSAYLVSNSNMLRAVKAISTERGRDPQDYTLVVYGGAGPIHGVALARELGIMKVIVAPAAGVFSALGLLFADAEHYFTQTFHHRLDEIQADDLNKVWENMKAISKAEIEAGYHEDVEVITEKFADLRYVGQASELSIPVPWEPVRADHIPLLIEKFNEEHFATYAHMRPDEPLEAINLRLVAKVKLARKFLPSEIRATTVGGKLAMTKGSSARQVYFGKDYGWITTPILAMEELSSTPKKGPMIIELYDTTCVVPPLCEVSLGEWETMIIDIKD